MKTARAEGFLGMYRGGLLNSLYQRCWGSACSLLFVRLEHSGVGVYSAQGAAGMGPELLRGSELPQLPRASNVKATASS